MESLAIELVLRYEELQGFAAEDRHSQKKLGHDVYSRNDEGEEKFIEIKSFQGEAGAIKLDEYQWKKAEVERNKYYVYIVSGLREGESPKLKIIQDPFKYLVSDPPVDKAFSRWENGVVKVVHFRKV